MTDKYQELKATVIEYLTTRDANVAEQLAKLVGLPYREPIEGAFLRAQGALKWEEGDELPEVTIRRMRDEEE